MIFAEQAKLSNGWASNVRVTHVNGRITAIAADQTQTASDTCIDTLLPALGNLHSHSFQRAMAGMTEYRKAGKDSFWTWRDLMYRFTANLTPEHIESIAAFVFLEMQEAGYASVGEFHYLHHQAGGTPYADLGEIVSGRKPGREKAGERTISINLGIALDDMATAIMIYKKAGEQGIGTELPL